MPRILFLGPNSLGSAGRSCSEGLRRLGCDVLDVDEETFIPQASRFTSRIGRRLLRFRMVREYNDQILRAAQVFHPDILLAIKGNYLLPDTLRNIGSMKVGLYNYYPDTSAFTHGKWIPRTLSEYDCVFYTKPFWRQDVTRAIKLKDAYFLPHGYDPALHRPLRLGPRDIEDFACDVSFIAFHTGYKEEILSRLIGLRPTLNLSIWGAGWRQRCRAPQLQRCIRGFHLPGESYSRGIQAARINLGIMAGIVEGASSGDKTTMRTYSIPACGGFMLHERNDEVLELYEEGREIACFASVEELAEKIDYYLAHPEERARIAAAGRARCVPAYSYDNRMAEILRWHSERQGISLPANVMVQA